MPAYAYPITIHREKQRVQYDETAIIEANSLTLKDLEFVGPDSFSVQEQEWGGYVITVSRSRMETDAERESRVAREESYMTEYNKRKDSKP
jgi:hypothetical protein